MEGDKQPSLAAAVFNWPAAPGFIDPPQPIPADWREQFISQYVLPDTEVLCGLYRSCGAGRQWVLTRAPHATLTLDCSAAAAVPDRLHQLSAVRRDLLARSSSDSLPTKLVVVCDKQCAKDGPFSALSRALADCGQAITDLQVMSGEGSQAPAFSTASAFLAEMAAVCPRLISLSINVPCLLPPPSALPHVTKLHFQLEVRAGDDAGEPIPDYHTPAVLQSAARLLPQLTTLQPHFVYRYADDYDEEPTLPWHSLFTPPQSTPQTLTCFKTTSCLDEELLELLLNHAPALRCLEVGPVQLSAGEFSQGEWGVTELHASGVMYDSYHTHSLACLPLSGLLTIHIPSVRFFATSAEGLPHKLVRRFAEWQFQVANISLLGADLPAGAEAAALRSTLSQLQGLQVTAPTDLHLEHWHWDADTAQAVSDAAPLLPHLPVRVYMSQPLTDALLGAVLRMGPYMRRLWVPSLALQSDQHANTPWPWEELSVGALDLAQFGRLPDTSAAQSQANVEVRCDLSVGADIFQVRHERVAERLRRTVIREWAFDDNDSGPLITLPCPQHNKHETLRAQLRVLHALERPKQSYTPRPKGYPMTQDTMDALCDLPVWSGALDLSACWPWPLEPTQYKALAQAIPPTYTICKLGDGVSQAVIDSICEGVNERREGLGLEPVSLAWSQHEGDPKTVGEHVEVVGCREGFFGPLAGS